MLMLAKIVAEVMLKKMRTTVRTGSSKVQSKQQWLMTAGQVQDTGSSQPSQARDAASEINGHWRGSCDLSSVPRTSPIAIDDIEVATG